MILEADILTEEVVKAIRAHAIEQFPKESMGYVQGGAYFKATNIHPSPGIHARIDKIQLLELMESGTLQALVHSHPNFPPCPSHQDMQAQLSVDVPFVICATDGSMCYQPFAWGDTIEPPPLWDRGFRHGVTDCYEFNRHWYKEEKGFLLPSIPRSWCWWKDGQSLYLEHTPRIGFHRIEPKDAQRGDMILFSVRSDVPNHAAIYLGGNQICHHSTPNAAWEPKNKPKWDLLSRWQPFMHSCLRHEKWL